MADIDKNSVGIVEVRKARVVTAEEPLRLRCGKTLGPIDVTYETYGTLNEAQDNVVLICHALSGDAHVAGYHSADDTKPGWWEVMVGPGKGIDTDKYFVICSNFLGGCMGTTGPTSINPDTGKPYGLDFPIITIPDMVNVQKLLLDKLGVKQVLAAIGGSVGGMQVIQWAIAYPDFVKAVLPIATTTHLSAQSIAFDAVGRNAILADANFQAGRYHDGELPRNGLAIARMIGHITYLSEQGMREKFGRELRETEQYNYDMNSEFAVETYLDYQGQSFVDRFDPNSYLYITKAADYFDPEKEYGSLAKAFENVKSRFLIVSFASDWLFTPGQSAEMVNALMANRKDVSFTNIASSYGHDAFLLEVETLGAFISGFIERTACPGLINGKSGNGKGPINHLDQARRTRVDYDLIESLIEPGATVLDVGCGDGQLLAQLTADKNIKGEGIELDQDMVLESVRRGVSVVQYNVEKGMKDYADNSFDYVILSQTLQTVHNTERVFADLLRIGRKVIVSFPNFSHWRCRIQLLFTGKAPKTRQLPFTWDNSPNIHCLSLKDFEEFCDRLGVKIEKRIPMIKTRLSPVKFAPNFFAEQAIYLTSKD